MASSSSINMMHGAFWRAWANRSRTRAAPIAHEHFHKIRTAHAEERHAGLSGHGLGQQGFTGSGRAHQQDALGHASAQIFKIGRVLEKIDDLLQFVLGLVAAGNIG